MSARSGACIAVTVPVAFGRSATDHRKSVRHLQAPPALRKLGHLNRVYAITAALKRGSNVRAPARQDDVAADYYGIAGEPQRLVLSYLDRLEIGLQDPPSILVEGAGVPDDRPTVQWK